MKIILATGYEVVQDPGWEDHLAQAILGEIFLSPLKNRRYNVDDALRLTFGECDRISKTYGIPYHDIIFNIMEKINFIRKDFTGKSWLN